MGKLTGKEKFDMRMQASGGSIRNERITAMQDVVDRLFADDPSYRDDVTIWPHNRAIPARIYEHKYRDAGTPRRQIQTHYNEPFHVGDIFEIGNEGYWLCIEAFDAHQMNYQGALEYCNYLLRFLVNGKIVEYPVVMKNATQYNSGETVKTQMTLGSSQHLIYIPYTPETILIDNGERFLIDRNRLRPTAYKLTQVDSSTYAYEDTGLLQWTVCEDPFSPQYDNAQLMVANYYGKKQTYAIQIVNATSPLSLSVGTELQLQVKVLINGHPDDQTAILYDSSNPSVATVSEYGMVTGIGNGSCSITIACGDAVEKLLINVENSTVNNICTITIIDPDGDSCIMYGDTEHFEIQICKDGIRLSNVPFEAEILSNDNVAEIVLIDKTTVSVQAFDDDKNVGKVFILHVWNSELEADASVTLKVGGLW